ncbi:16S rRNA (uracil(1498)-N(3))-methyltransferase [Propionibacteriaceae bacterium Y2011]
MTDPVFLAGTDDRLPEVGQTYELAGEEGRHAAVVRRIAVGEVIIVADGIGGAIRGPVVSASKKGLVVEVAERLTQPATQPEVIAVQALAKGDRGELAVELMTEVGVTRFVPWQATRSIVRWTTERADKTLGRWRSTAREAAKQSRRFRVPTVDEAMTTDGVTALLADCAVGLVLHETATETLPQVLDPSTTPAGRPGPIMIIIGPEGGITDDELAAFTAAGARPALISDGVLRTSTAGAVAAGWLRMGRP